MDVEKTIEFLLEQQAAHAARFDADMARISAKMQESTEKFDRQDKLLERRLDRAVRLSNEEHRRERVRRKQLADTLDAAMSRLAAAQEKTEKTLQQFIESMKQGRNGHDKS